MPGYRVHEKHHVAGERSHRFRLRAGAGLKPVGSGRGTGRRLDRRPRPMNLGGVPPRQLPDACRSLR
jgi:hypothetical protein